MSGQILILAATALGLGLSTIPGATMTPGLAKGLSWLIAGAAKLCK